MKKLYLCLLAIAACFNLASADGWDFVLTVTQGVEKVKAYTGSTGYSKLNYDNLTEITLVEGDNDIHLEHWTSLVIVPLNENDVVSLKDKNGRKEKSSYDNYYDIYANYAGPQPPYTLAVYSEEEYRTKTVKVNILDDFSKVKIVRQDKKEFIPTENTIEIPYNEFDENLLSIRPAGYDYKLYKVEADGKDIAVSNTWYSVDLVDRSGDEPVYVENIDVTANFPEGMTFKTTIALDGPTEAISSIKINDVEVEDIESCLSEDGFDVPALAVVKILFNDKLYKIDNVTVNDESKYVYGQLTLDMVDKDQNISIKAHKLATYTVKFNITNAVGISASRGYNDDIVFQEGENIINFVEGNNRVTFKTVTGWDFAVFTDLNGYDYIQDLWYGSIEIKAEEGEEYTIEVREPVRENQIVVYFGNFGDVEFDIKKLSYYSCCFSKYDTPSDKMVAGYNVINFRDEDGYFKVYASTYTEPPMYTDFYAYKNCEVMPADWAGAKYREDESVADGDVYKFFFDNDPGEHTVTFEVGEGALEGYEVVKDIIVPTDVTAPVKAVGPTRFTISPVARAAEGLAVTVGDKTIEAEDGVYTFETVADTTVKVALPGTSGIEDLLNDANSTADVYNLQGIRVARQANAADIKALPAGLYIVNGSKVIVK